MASSQRPEVLTFFTARADGVHVPQSLHEGGVNLEFPTRGRQMLGSETGE